MVTFDPQTALRASGSDPATTDVVAYAELDDYAAALIDGPTPAGASQSRVHLFRRTSRGWSKPTVGDGEVVSDGIAMAVWDPASQRIVIGYVQPNGEGGLAPMSAQGPDRAGVLLWLTVQAIAFWPAVAGPYIWTMTGRGYLLLTMQFVMFCVIAFLITRNLVRLWRGPAPIAGRASTLVPLVLGLLFAAFATPPLLDERLSSKPLGAVWLLIAVNLLLVAIREGMRLARLRRSAA